MQSEQQEILIKFGKRLEELRKNQNLSLRKLALHCNIDHADIKKYENGEINISLISITELAKGLDLPISELMNF
jgi:transcriptional regulator with XRE-family HTH domain